MEVAVKGDKTEADTSDIPKYDSQEYILRKRLPRRLPKRPNDVYLSRKTDFRAQLARQAAVVGRSPFSHLSHPNPNPNSYLT